MEERRAGEVGKRRRRDVVGGASVVLLDVGDLLARGDDAEPGVLRGQSLEQRLDGGVLELALHRAGRMLKRLQAIEHEQAAHPAHELASRAPRSHGEPSVGSGSPKVAAPRR